ncbi:endonuclease/exonuclease/phosphatase family protein [uncultured Desulfosarcina sp.]|uniref:endonuclease/exonuclease/phosphatase family protein n=1 Tax=uncultured Desulfosarcina sp. TaxID=218289 RepID=UPI0029C70722|nr:endonuclease/exonuclease/phosphatase family protein [uncultured Desulfosarcina sp.]
MKVTVGTFNLNNLFSRFNFDGAITELKKPGATSAMTIRYEFTDQENYRIRTFMGKLVIAKKEADIETIAKRILAMNVDVLAVQEVEDIDILKAFNSQYLGNLYPYRVLIEGNDPRFIDVGILSKMPIGAGTSHQTAVHPQAQTKPVFGRDLLEAEILNQNRTRKLFTLYNNHLKSHFGDDDNSGQGKTGNDTRRQQQAEMIRTIVSSRQNKNAKYVIVGDMNDPPDSAQLQAMLTIDGNPIVNALTNPAETRPAKKETVGPGPQTTAWTYRHKASGQPPTHSLYDQIWLSPAIAPALQGATIDRRTTHGGDGSDHDPAWIELDL